MPHLTLFICENVYFVQPFARQDVKLIIDLYRKLTKQTLRMQLDYSLEE